ncbi:MAG: CARDB domain-containing protein [Myxococcota bacterium]
MRSTARAAFAALCAFALIAGVAAAGVQQKSLFKGAPQPVGIALDAAGRLHFSWQSLDLHLHYTLLDRGKKHDQIVDATAGSGSASSIAVDRAGHPHIAYQAQRPNASGSVLAYAHFDGTQWQIEDLGAGGDATAIAIDASDEPHIAHALASGAVEILNHSEGSWERDLPDGLSSAPEVPLSLALDSAGKTHVAMETTAGRPAYATNASGDWVSEELAPEPARGASLALDSLGLPRVALALSDPATIRYSRFDGAQWVSEDLYDPNDFGSSLVNDPRGAALALDPNDVPRILFTTNFTQGTASLEFSVFAYRDGAEWRLITLAAQNAGDLPRLLVGGDGIARGTYPLLSKGAQIAEYVSVAQQDLRGEWTSLSQSAAASGVTTIQGALTVHNDGPGKSPSTPYILYLSDDAALDGQDVPVVLGKKLGGVAAGSTRTLKIKLKTRAAIAGKYLIAVLDPDRITADADRTNNVAVSPPLQ